MSIDDDQTRDKLKESANGHVADPDKAAETTLEQARNVASSEPDENIEPSNDLLTRENEFLGPDQEVQNSNRRAFLKKSIELLPWAFPIATTAIITNAATNVSNRIWNEMTNKNIRDELAKQLVSHLEDRDYLQIALNRISTQKPINPLEKDLVEFCLMNLNGQSGTNEHPDPMLELNYLTKLTSEGGAYTRSIRQLVRLIRAKYKHLNGLSHESLDDYYMASKQAPSDNLTTIYAKYNWLNVSYSLRNKKLYGNEAVSTNFLTENNEQLDAMEVVRDLCASLSVEPENFNENSIKEYCDGFSVSAAKLIYLYHLECILREGDNPVTRKAHLEEILRFLQILSRTPKKNPDEGWFTWEAWYPLVFMHVVMCEFSDFELADRINMIFRDFSGWGRPEILRQEFQSQWKEKATTLQYHMINRARLTGIRESAEAEADLLAGFECSFEMSKGAHSPPPVIQRALDYRLRQIDSSRPIRKILTPAMETYSHRNYLF